MSLSRKSSGQPAPAPKVELVNLGDTAGLKRALDDEVVKILCEQGHALDHTHTDLKIGLGLLACATALAAQFWPAKYPASAPALAACVAAYAALSAAMAAHAAWFEGDCVAMTRGGGGGGAGGGGGLRLGSRLPRFQDEWTLRARPRGGGGGEAVLRRSVGAYFDTEGALVADALRADVVALLARVGGGGGGAASGKKQL